MSAGFAALRQACATCRLLDWMRTASAVLAVLDCVYAIFCMYVGPCILCRDEI